MSGLQIDLNRLQISLKGVSAELVNDALTDLSGELHRQLQGVRLPNNSLSVNAISLRPLTLANSVDALQLRALIAEHIVLALSRAGEGGER